MVDDDDGVRRSLCRFFRAYGFAARDYPSGEAFLATMPSREPGCLILDFHLGGSDALEILRRARAQGCSLPVIILTGNEDTTLEQHALQSGVSAFFRKPVDPHVVASKIIETLGSDT